MKLFEAEEEEAEEDASAASPGKTERLGFQGCKGSGASPGASPGALHILLQHDSLAVQRGDLRTSAVEAKADWHCQLAEAACNCGGKFLFCAEGNVPVAAKDGFGRTVFACTSILTLSVNVAQVALGWRLAADRLRREG